MFKTHQTPYEKHKSPKEVECHDAVIPVLIWPCNYVVQYAAQHRDGLAYELQFYDGTTYTVPVP